MSGYRESLRVRWALIRPNKFRSLGAISRVRCPYCSESKPFDVEFFERAREQSSTLIEVVRALATPRTAQCCQCKVYFDVSASAQGGINLKWRPGRYGGGKGQLILSSLIGDFEAAKLWIERGVDVNERVKKFTDFNYCTPLLAAVNTREIDDCSVQGKKKIIELLVDKGADLESVDCRDETPLLNAGFAELTLLLLEMGANPHKVDDQGYSALHGAVIRGQMSVVEVLLKLGVDTSVRNKSGQCALDLARDKGQEQVIELLLKSCQSPNNLPNNARSD